MEFIYFVFAFIVLLVFYYAWVIKQEISPKKALTTNEVEEEIEYEFAEPVRVSEEYIKRGASKLQKAEKEQHQGNEDVIPVSSDTSSSTASSEVEFFHVIDYSAAKNSGRALASLVREVLSPTVSSTASSEVEFFHLKSMKEHIEAGHQMFSGI